MGPKSFIFIIITCFSVAGCISDKDTDTPGEKNHPSIDHRSEFIPVSVWYSGGKARAPMLSTINGNSEKEWREDLKKIKDLGFNAVRTWVEWAHCEPRPGEYHFENLQLLARLAKEHDLKFLIQLYVDSAPDWVGKKYADGLYETQSGAQVKSQAAPGFCTDHPGVRKAVLNFITETAKNAVKHDNFHGWDLWSEPHIVNWAYINYVPNVQFCFCAHTKARFRSWLKDKYTTMDLLNNAWYRNFASWEDVDPPRFGTILSYTDFIDWKNFIYEKLAGDLGMRYRAIRVADKSHVITSHAAVPSIFYSPYNGYGATDDFLMAEQVDYYGTSLYPKHNHPARHWEIWKFMVAVDFARCANKKKGGFYVGELQAGKGTYGLNIGNPISPGDHRIWMWSAIAKGAKALNIYAFYPMSSGYESGGYGLINLDASITERAIQAGQMARIIDANRKLLLNSVSPPAQIALLYNPLAQMVGGEQRHARGDMHQVSLFGYYRLFAENNIPVDFIHRRDLEAGDVSQYKLLIIPYPLMFTQKAADRLKEYIASGGCAVTEARPAWNDERGYATNIIPGMGLAEVFGAQESNIKMEEDVRLRIAKSTHPLTQNITPGTLLSGAYFAESFEVAKGGNSTVIAELPDGAAAMVAGEYDRGRTLLIGSFLGMAYHGNSEAISTQFLTNLLNWAEIENPVKCSMNTPVEIRLREHEHGILVFIVNHGETNKNVEISLDVDAEAGYSISDIINHKRTIQNSNNKILTFTAETDARDVLILNIERSDRLDFR